MKTFEQWLTEEHPLEEGMVKNLALGAALTGGLMGGIGYMRSGGEKAPNAKQIQNQSVTSPDAGTYMGSNKGYNSQLGHFTVIELDDGKPAMQTKDGTIYRAVNNRFGKVKYTVVR